MQCITKGKYDEEFRRNVTVLRYGMKPDQDAAETLEEREAEDRKGFLSISELAKFARISRSALIFYDNMGLVSPVERGDNNYRYYSPHQVATTNLINTLQELSVPLKEIIGLSNKRTPEKMIALFSEQNKQIDRQIDDLLRAQKLLLTLKSAMEEGVSADEDKMEVRWDEEEPILVGPQIDYSGGTTIEEALHGFYKYCSDLDCDLDLNYPVWGIYSEERIKSGYWLGPDNFYFKMPDGPDRKPAGLYATGYVRGYYGHNGALYKKLITYIEQNGFEICGPSYEMYPLNEISISDPYSYLMKISISVKKI